jgi:hypothetical protein
MVSMVRSEAVTLVSGGTEVYTSIVHGRNYLFGVNQDVSQGADIKDTRRNCNENNTLRYLGVTGAALCRFVFSLELLNVCI